MRRGGRTGAVLLATLAIVAAAASPAAAQEKPKADDVGITDTEIRIAVVADVDNPVVPALFKSGVDAVRRGPRRSTSRAGSRAARSSSTSSTRG
jgi:hypothetical protein